MRPDLEDPSRFSRLSPSLSQVVSYICIILAGGVLMGSSFSRGSLIIKGIQLFLEGLLRNCKRCPRKSCPCLLVSSSCDEEGVMGFSSLFFRRA